MFPTTRVSLAHGTPAERRARLSEAGERRLMEHLSLIDAMSIEEWTAVFQDLVENVIGTFVMPLSIAPHFKVDGVQAFVPMVTEERSVVAALSKAAKLAPSGFATETGPLVSRGHASFFGLPMPAAEAARLIEPEREAVIGEISGRGFPYKRHGGGPVGLTLKICSHPDHGEILVVGVEVATGQAMGANGVTRIAEMAGEIVGRKLGVAPAAAICVNDSPARAVLVRCLWQYEDGLTEEQAERVLKLQAWAEADPDRAVTHNKGIMNGIDAVCLATGQDVRAVEAGGSADAYRDGVCRPLTRYRRLPTGLVGQLRMQLTVGAVGGATAHPLARWCRALAKAETVERLMAVIGAVGLAQNFAALLCLGGEGINEAHRRIAHRKDTHP